MKILDPPMDGRLAGTLLKGNILISAWQQKMVMIWNDFCLPFCENLWLKMSVSRAAHT